MAMMERENFQIQLTLVLHLCDIHMKGNIKRKLSDQNIKGHIGKEYIMENRFILKGYRVLWAVATQRYSTKNWNLKRL